MTELSDGSFGNKVADTGKIWVCLACGKTSQDHYGTMGRSHGWDESCMMNSIEIEIDRLVFYPNSKRVKEIKDIVQAQGGSSNGEF